MKLAKHIILLITCFFTYANCFAKHEKLDSLLKILPSLYDTARVGCLNALSYEYILSGQKDSATYYSNAAYEDAKKMNYIHGIAVAFSMKSHIARRFYDDFVRSEEMGEESFRWFEKTPNKAGYDKMYDKLMDALFAQSKFETAMPYLENYYAYAQQSGDTLQILKAMQRLFAIFRLRGNYEKSFLFTQQAYELATKSKNKIWIAKSLYNMAQLYMLVEEYPAALSYFRKVSQLDDNDTRNERIISGNDIWFKMEFAEVFSHLHQFDSAWHYYKLFKPENLVYKRIYQVSTGECYYLQQDYPRLENFLPALEEHKKLNDRNEIMRTLLDIGKTHVALNNSSDALKYGKEGLTIALQTKAKRFIRDGYQILFTVYDQLQQKDSANFYFRQYASMKDSVLNDQAKGKFTAYNYEQKIGLIKEAQQAQLKQEALIRKTLIAGIGVLCLLAFIIFRNVSLKRRNEKLQLEHEMELQKLESDRAKTELQQQATELEMQALRAQMNPHFIFNSLNSINRFILQNNKEQASEYLTKFSKLVRLILQNSNATLITLESELEALQLYLELESLRFNHRFSFKISVDDEIDAEIIKVPPLIIQPYAENAIWHGLMHKTGIGNLEIEIKEEKNFLQIKISDDGIGRKKAAKLKSKSAATHKSMGLKITEDRITMMNREENKGMVVINDLVLADGRSGGTEVILKIPLVQ